MVHSHGGTLRDANRGTRAHTHTHTLTLTHSHAHQHPHTHEHARARAQNHTCAHTMKMDLSNTSRGTHSMRHSVQHAVLSYLCALYSPIGGIRLAVCDAMEPRKTVPFPLLRSHHSQAICFHGLPCVPFLPKISPAHAAVVIGEASDPGFTCRYKLSPDEGQGFSGVGV